MSAPRKPSGSSTPSHAARDRERRRQKRRSHGRGRIVAFWSVTAVVVLAAAGGYFARADMHARPKASVVLNPATNQLRVTLMPGAGPLAHWVYQHSSLNTHLAPENKGDVPAQPATSHTFLAQLQPDETVKVTNAVQGPLLAEPPVTQTVTVPPAPAIKSKRTTPTVQVLTFATVPQSVKEISGPAHAVASVHGSTVTLKRITTAYAIRLRVTDADGESSVVADRVPALPPVPVYFFGSSADNHVYITIDDGWVPDPRVITLVKQDHVPLTAFLIDAAAREHLGFWKAFAAAGGVIEDHTDTHPFLTRVSATEDVAQWGDPVKNDQVWFHETPLVGRPPYGALNDTVRSAAGEVGLRAIVMWSAEFNPGDPAKGLETWNGAPLSAGEIVLLHWQPGLYRQLQEVLTICRQRGLVPAPLLSGLPLGAH